MSATRPVDMHRDHRAWNADNEFWREEIRLWQQETTEAAADLERVTKALAEHEQKLERHASAVRLYGQEAAQHEHELTRAAQAVKGADVVGHHEDEAVAHRRMREVHESLKKTHHMLLARLSMLLKAINV